MPLLKGRFVLPVNPIIDVKPNETVYTIPHTGERFRSKDEFEERLALYEEAVWTCQASGQIKLTHQEALESEQDVIKSLKTEFQEFWEKPVLEIVHHSTDVLDVLTDSAWRRLHEELHINEPVTLTVASGKRIEGIISKVDKTGVDSKSSTCSSPSSNKENSDDDIATDKRRTKSPVKSLTKKTSFPKLLSYKYSVKLKNEDKIVNGIPAADLTRVHRLPLKDLVKTYIRSFAWRGGFHQNSPWVVKEELIEKYNLKHKLANIFLSPSKMSEIGRKVLEDKVKASNEQKKSQKRKRTQSQDPKKSAKKQKTSKSPKKQEKLLFKSQEKKSPKKSSSTPKKSPKKAVDASIDSSSSESSSDSDDEDKPLAVIKNSPKSTPKKNASISTPSSSPRKRGRPSKAESEVIKLEKEQLAKEKAEKKERRLQKKLAKSKAVESGTPKKRGRPKGSTNSPKKLVKPKNMKQITLFDMKSKKKNGSSTPKKSPTKSPKKSPFKIPPLAQRLLKAMESNNKPVYFQLVARCSKLLPLSQIKQLPDKIREPIMKKYNLIEEKKKLEKMTPEQKEEYLKKKKEEQKKKLNELLKTRRIEQNKRFEDQDLDLKSIPTPRLVETPDGFANELFGNVAMVTEFISCYKALLTPKDDTTIKNVTTESLVNSLVSDSKGYGAVAHVLTTLLQTLLQDTIAEDYEELSLKMSEIPVNAYTASELVRLCLRKRDEDDSEEENSDEESVAGDDDLDLPEELIERLETCEFFELEPEDKLTILLALCHRLMGSYSVQDYMEQKQRDAAELWKRRIAEQKERNDKKKGQKQLKKEMKGKQNAAKSVTNGKDNGMTLNSFYGKTEEEEAEESLDLASVVKRRRLMVGKMAELKRKQEEEEKNRREECRKDKEFEILEKEFQDGISAAKWSYRQTPVGCDRNHNRYWLFHKSTPGLFVEKGWVSTEMEYCVKRKDDTSDSSDEELESIAESTQNENKPGRKKEGYQRCVEKTFPHTGQNLWFMYDKMDDVDKLIGNLHSLGVRDSALKAKLKEKYNILTSTMQLLSKKQPVELEPVDMVEGFREELSDMETRLAAGGLGGVTNATDWEKKLDNAKTVQEFGQCLIACQANIFEKFLKGILIQKAKRPKVKTEEEEEDKEDDGEDKEEKDEDEAEESEEDMVAVGVERWKESIINCTTFSRLHVLMGILDGCIKWEKSAENAKCKICRKKGDEDKLLLCDQCNQAYHLYCLRPALTDIPDGEWFCPACVPSTRRVTRIKDETKNYRMLAGYDDTEDDSEDSAAVKPANSLECEVCGGDEGIFPCSTCVSSFHLDCHEPQLRREPRSTWRCMQCTSGVRIRKSRRAATQKKLFYAYDEDDDFSIKPKKSGRRSKVEDDYDDRPKKSSRQVRKRASRYQESDTEEDEEEPTRKSTRMAKKPRKRYDQSDESDEESEEESEEDSEATEIEEEIVPKSRRSRSTGPSSNKKSKGRRSGNAASEENVSPSSAHQTRRKGDRHLVNGELVEKEIYDASQKIMMEVLKKLRRHKCAWPFMEPVDAKLVPDYFTIVKIPMDLQTIENKCISEQYKDPQQFVDDITIMMDNSYLYNKKDSQVGKCTEPLEKHFCKLIIKHLPWCSYPRMPGDMMNGSESHNDSGNTSQNGFAIPPEILEEHAYSSPSHSSRR